jgi:hypothetical protein
MKFLSRNAPALGTRIALNTREKCADFLEPPRKKPCVVYIFGAVLLD